MQYLLNDTLEGASKFRQSTGPTSQQVKNIFVKTDNNVIQISLKSILGVLLLYTFRENLGK
jgi:hypothetical protein